MGMVDAARSGKLKMKHLIFPSCKPAPLHSGYWLSLASAFALCWALSFWSLSSFSSATLYMKSRQSAVLHLPCQSLYSFLFIPHRIFVFFPTPWYLTVYSYPSPLLQSCSWLFFSVYNTFLSSAVNHIFFQMHLCQDHSERWLCPPVLAVPHSLPPPGDLVSVLFPVGAKNRARLPKK